MNIRFCVGVLFSVGVAAASSSVNASAHFEQANVGAIPVATANASIADAIGVEENALPVINIQYAPGAMQPLRRVFGGGVPAARQNAPAQQSRPQAAAPQTNAPAGVPAHADAPESAQVASAYAESENPADGEGAPVDVDELLDAGIEVEGQAAEQQTEVPAQEVAPIQETAPVQETPAETPAAQVPPESADDAAEREEKVREATEAQTENNSAEDKSRALVNGNANAPDAPVQLNVEVTDADVKASEQQATEEIKQEEPPKEEKPVGQPKLILGYRGAEKAVRDMTSDILENLKARNGLEFYNRWRAYNMSIRKRTNSLQTGNELNSRCRLKWYEKLYQDPIQSVVEVERVSRAFGQCFMGDAQDVLAGTRLARKLSDVPARLERKEPKAATSPNDALDLIRAALVETASLHAKAVAPMNQKDIDAVKNEAHAIFCGQVQSGHTVPSRGRAQYLVDALEKMNKGALYDAGETLLAALDQNTIEQLRNLDFGALEKRKLSSGNVVGLIHCEAGDILIGGPEDNTWELDRLAKACCVIDLGGNDTYSEGSCVLNRPILFVLDLGQGADRYVGKNAAIQGGAILGVSVWYDDGGNDDYLAKDVCQGSAIGGFGALINEGGNDKYLGFLRAQGTALGGFGLLIDRAGNDDYRAALIAQGFGAPGGFGALVDKDGKDHYYVGGYYFDSYPEHPGYDGWGQGVGAGIRRVACGGIGALLDGGGDDAYEYDYFGHGGGYWMGIGFARDFGGNDVRYAATSTMYDGSRRREQRWQRFGAGFGCHYACGYLFDDSGNDVYGGTIMGVGMGWDLGAGFLVDFMGDDSFEATGGLTCGAGGEGSIGAIMNYRGSDTYYGNSQGYASGQLTYHSQSNCGANFSFVVDHGGKDSYGGYDNYRRPIQNNSITQRGGVTGLIIDRPSPTEEQANANAAPEASNAQQAQTPPQRGSQQTQQTQQQRRQQTAQGYPTEVSQIRTMVQPPPLYDTNPHVTSSGSNAFNPTNDFGGSYNSPAGFFESGGQSVGPFGGFFGGR